MRYGNQLKDEHAGVWMVTSFVKNQMVPKLNCCLYNTILLIHFKYKANENNCLNLLQMTEMTVCQFFAPLIMLVDWKTTGHYTCYQYTALMAVRSYTDPYYQNNFKKSLHVWVLELFLFAPFWQKVQFLLKNYLDLHHLQKGTLLN